MKVPDEYSLWHCFHPSRPGGLSTYAGPLTACLQIFRGHRVPDVRARGVAVEVVAEMTLLRPSNAPRKVTHHGLVHVPLSSYMQARDTK